MCACVCVCTRMYRTSKTILIKAVILGIPNYVMSTFCLPSTRIEDIHSFDAKF